MERLELFQQLCAATTALETLTRTLEACAIRDALEALVQAFDEIINTIVLATQEETGCV